MLKIPIQIEYTNIKDGKRSIRRIVPFPAGSEQFANGNTCITAYDVSVKEVRRFENSHIMRITSCAFPVRIPKEHQKWFGKKENQ